jgi:hypothetical protein
VSQLILYTRDHGRAGSRVGLTSVEETSRTALPGPRAGSFDVRAWLAGLKHVSTDSVTFVSENERAGRRTVVYECAGRAVKVRVAPVAGAAAWELVAELDDSVDRVVLPGATRFLWRAPRGPHP